MRSVSTRGRRRAISLVLVIAFGISAAYADEPNPFAPPQAKIGPPAGLKDSAAKPAKINPPTGTLAGVTPARLSPPTGTSQRELRSFDLFWLWLQVHAKIRPPIG